MDGGAGERREDETGEVLRPLPLGSGGDPERGGGDLRPEAEPGREDWREAEPEREMVAEPGRERHDDPGRAAEVPAWPSHPLPRRGAGVGPDGTGAAAAGVIDAIVGAGRWPSTLLGACEVDAPPSLAAAAALGGPRERATSVADLC